MSVAWRRGCFCAAQPRPPRSNWHSSTAPSPRPTLPQPAKSQLHHLGEPTCGMPLVRSRREKQPGRVESQRLAIRRDDLTHLLAPHGRRDVYIRDIFHDSRSDLITVVGFFIVAHPSCRPSVSTRYQEKPQKDDCT